jgi:iron complex transport system substrate-binding protein
VSLKRRRKQTSVFYALLTLFIFLSAGSAWAGVAVTDDLGRKLVFDATPQRIVATASSSTAIVFDLGLDEVVVGVASLTQFLSYVPEVQRKAEQKEKVGGIRDLNLEKIVALKPDFVVLDSSQAKFLSQLDELGARLGFKTYVSGPKDIDGIVENVVELGLITGSLRRAKEIVGDIEFKRFRLRDAVAGLDHKKEALFIIWHDPVWTTGSDTFMGQALELAGLKNIFGDIEGFKVVGREEVVRRAPETIIVGPGVPIALDDLRRLFGNIRAVENKDILIMTQEMGSMIEQPQTKVVDGIIGLFELVYKRGID